MKNTIKTLLIIAGVTHGTAVCAEPFEVTINSGPNAYTLMAKEKVTCPAHLQATSNVKCNVNATLEEMKPTILFTISGPTFSNCEIVGHLESGKPRLNLGNNCSALVQLSALKVNLP